MNSERRSNHATGLREFFDDQLQYLQDLLNGQQQSSTVDTSSRDIEHFVDVANSKLRIVRGYADKLRSQVSALQQHVLTIVEQIPPVVELSHQAFVNDALVNALFAVANDIDRLLVIGSDVEGFCRRHLQASPLYALMSARKAERNVFGVGLLGEMLVRDLPQQTVNFFGHTLHAPCADSDALYAALNTFLLDQVITLLKQDLTARSLAQTLKSNAHSYQACINSLANPDRYLEALLEAMQQPEKLLTVEICHYRLSKLGIKLESGDSDQYANDFKLPELQWSDGSRNVLLQVSYHYSMH